MNRDSRIVEIELNKLVPNRFQPRKTFGEDVSELAESIRAHGILQPITVRPLGEKYEIIMGERRYRACEKLGLHTIPAMVVDMNDREAMEVALIENLQRQDLNAIEEALSYKRILNAGYITQEQLAQRIGKNQSTIANKLRLLTLEKEVQKALLQNQISERHARSLLRLKDRDQQLRMLKKVVDEKMTVKRLDAEIDKIERYGAYQIKDDPIEIIDFDDNPFVENEPQVSENNQSGIELEDYSNYNKTETEDSVSNWEDTPKVSEKESKKKPTVPSLGIVDDFDNPDDLVVVETNHGFNDAVNGPSIQNNDLDLNIGNQEDETETVELANVEPDTIDPIVEQAETESPEDINMPKATTDFTEIERVINNCQSELARLGYNVRMEKYDFEKMFQVILKIDK